MARREYVDTGIWINLNTGQIQLTHGAVNPRVRWEGMLTRDLQLQEFKKIRSLA